MQKQCYKNAQLQELSEVNGFNLEIFFEVTMIKDTNFDTSTDWYCGISSWRMVTLTITGITVICSVK